MRCVASENVTSSHSTRQPVTSVWVSLIRECKRRYELRDYERKRRVNYATTNRQACKRRYELRDYERVFANDRRSFRNGITNTKCYPQA